VQRGAGRECDDVFSGDGVSRGRCLIGSRLCGNKAKGYSRSEESEKIHRGDCV